MFVIDTALLQALVFLLLLIFVDALLGLAVALRDGTFNMAEVPRFLRTEVLPYYIGILAMAMLAMIKDVQQLGTKQIAWSIIVIYAAKMFFIEIRQKLAKIFDVDLDQFTTNKKRSGN